MSPRVNWARGCQSEGLEDSPNTNPDDHCVSLQLDRADFSIEDSFGGGFRAKLMMVFDPDVSSEYTLKDNSYIKLNYDQLSDMSIQAPYPVAELTHESDYIRMDIHDSVSSSGVQSFSLIFSNVEESDITPTSFTLCHAGEGHKEEDVVEEHTTLTPTEFCYDVTEVISVASAWACRGCVMLQGVGAELLPEVVTTDGYLEFELSNDAEFSEHYHPAKNAVNVEGNIWRMTFESDMENVLFSSMMYYSGSTAMAPVVKWAQMCHDNSSVVTQPPTTVISETTEVTTEEMTLPNDAICVQLMDFTYDNVEKWTYGQQVLISASFSNDISSDYAVRDESYLMLTYALPFAEANDGTQADVELFPYWPADEDSIIAGNIIVFNLNDYVTGNPDLNIEFQERIINNNLFLTICCLHQHGRFLIGLGIDTAFSYNVELTLIRVDQGRSRLIILLYLASAPLRFTKIGKRCIRYRSTLPW